MAKRYANLRLWMRLGDLGEYESFGTDLDAVVDQLREAGVHDVAQTRGGITAPGFTGDNYISLYWGDKSANLVSPITRAEFARIRRALSSRKQRFNPMKKRRSRHMHHRVSRKRGLFGRVPLWAWIGAAAAAWVVRAKLSSKGTGL